MIVRILLFSLLPLLSFAQSNSKVTLSTNKQTSEKGPLEQKRNTIFNLDEIKVRWKKAALENCPWVVCPTSSVPGPCTTILATPMGPSSANVSFVPPTNDGGSPITGYIVTATPTSSAPAKRKLSSVIVITGTSSPILVTGLSFGINYIFSVLATNAIGGSPPITTTTTVTPCILNTALAASTNPTLDVNTVLIPSITVATTGATGIGTATGLPGGVTAGWSSNLITISGTPTATGTFNYTIPLTGGCGTVIATGTITVTAANTAGAASSTPTLCISNVLTNITHTTTGATGIGSATGLPAGVSAAWASNTITISGIPTVTGTFNYTIPLTGGYGSVNATGTITVAAVNTVSAASSTPTQCISTALTNITHTTIGATGIGSATGLPNGVSAAFASNTITISGTPTATGTFNYSILLTGGCGSVSATGTITVTAANTVSAASSTQTLCISTALTDITHTTTEATGIGSATGLPAGVSATFASNTITISGTPTATGTFNYSIPLTGGCSSVSATGTITVTAANIAGTASSTPTLCISTALTDITHTSIGATGIGTATGLPAGVTAAWSSNTITISGTPTATGTFNYSIPLMGGCGSVNATGTITVAAVNTVSAASSTPTQCISTALTTSITHTTTGATGIGTATGLPAGVSAVFASNTITISGTPTATGTFNYSIPLTGGCGSVSATGTITVTAANTVTAASSTPTLCISTALTDITHTTTEATGIGTATGLPAGVSAAFASNTITMSGTPSASGTFNYSIPLTGGCGNVNATGTITVTPANIAGTASSNPSLQVNTSLTNITITTTGATGISNDAVSGASGLPAGVSATWAGNIITISGTPSASGIFTYIIPLTGGCGTVNATGTITVCSVLNTAGTPSTSPTLVANSALTPITIATTGATGIGTATGLPAGVTAAFASNTITISGTPTVSNTYNYSIPLTGGCGTVNATGTMTVIPACPIGKDTIWDIDNNSYKFVTIGTQCWTKENLRVRKYNDGTSILFDKTSGSDWQNLVIGAHTIYEHDSTAITGNLAIYGYLYNWYAAKGIASTNSTTYKNICPSGWHIPTDSDWNKLVKFLDSGADTITHSANIVGGMLKSTLLWAAPNTGATNSSEFSVLPGGFRGASGSFQSIWITTFFWSSTDDAGTIRNRYLRSTSANMERNTDQKWRGGSLRCLKD